MNVTDVLGGVDERLPATREVVRHAQESQNDTQALMGLHTLDAVIVNVAGRRILSRAAFKAAMRPAMTSSLAKVTT